MERSLRRSIWSLCASALIVSMLSACDGTGPAAASSTSAAPAAPVSPGSPTTSPTPPATPVVPPATSGPTAPTCVNGWTTPDPGTARFTDPLGIVRRTTGVEGPLVVVDMRYFVGPESPNTDQGYLLEVERWYIKLYAQDDLAFQGRFLVEARRFGRGVSAVAPYDSKGFRSPDWVGFQYDSADLARRAYPGLPGRWAGHSYDFVRGGAGLKIPGLPDEVKGCLDGT